MAPVDRYTCEDVFRQLDAYMDRELSADDVRRLEEHLDTCATCTAEHKFESSLLQGLKDKVRRIAVPPNLMGKISRLIADQPEGGGSKN
jgi:anti-sigma factor (TIGR02949 family)